jgi:hypothetical protein
VGAWPVARAEALAGLAVPKTCEPVEFSEIRRDSGGVLYREVSPDVSDDAEEDRPENEKTPSGERVSSRDDTAFQRVSVDVNSGGGGNCTRRYDSSSRFTIAFEKSTEAPGSEIGRNREILMLDPVEMDIRWPSLPSPIVHATLALAGSQS